VYTSIRWSEVDARLDDFLDDTAQEGQEQSYSERLRLEGWNCALHFLALHTPYQKSESVTVDTDGRSAVLPPGLLDVWRVYDSDNERWLRRLVMGPEGGVRYDDDDLDFYWLWAGKLRFEREVDPSLVLYYWAYWPEVEYDESGESLQIVQGDIVVPPWAIHPLLHLTAAYCLQPGAIQAARTRQWNIQVDSGTPLHNVRAQQAREHWWWWNELLGKVPPVDRR